MVRNITTLRGILDFVFVGGPHYEVKDDDGNLYVLFGKLKDIDKLKNHHVEIQGTVMNDVFTIFMRGIPFYVDTIRELNLNLCRHHNNSMIGTLNEASAYRKDGKIHIFMNGKLPTPCHEIKVVGKYPGNIVHIADPGAAELFIGIHYKQKYEGMHCIHTTVPFFIVEEIEDLYHNEVIIYVDDKIKKRIKVEEQFESQYKCKNKC